MIPTVGCHQVQDQLEAFVDGELTVGEQVLVESHLRSCRTCATRVEDLSRIGAALRQCAWSSGDTREDLQALQRSQADVVGRVGAEHDQSAGVRFRELFADMRLLWPAIGATLAVVVCASLAAGVLHAASVDRPESLAAMIESLADPGSDRNPMRLDDAIMIPRALSNGLEFDGLEFNQFGGDDAVLAVATVVTREGRIGDYALLESGHGTPRQGTRSPSADVEELLGAVKLSRFAPAQAPGGRVVAVNMVWLIARTTVKGSREYPDLAIPLTRPATVVPAAPRIEPKPAVLEPEAPHQQGADAPIDSTTA